MDIQIFNHPDFGDVRTAGTPDEPYFCLVDVCKALDLRPDYASRQVRDLFESGHIELADSKESNATASDETVTDKTISANEDDLLCKEVTEGDEVYTTHPTEGITPTTTGVTASTAMIQLAFKDALGRDRMTNFINEAGLYELIFSSRKPSAKAFKKWVMLVVLPAIRKQGFYAPQAIPASKHFSFDGGKVTFGEMQFDNVYEFLFELFSNNLTKQLKIMGDLSDISQDIDTLKKQVNKMVRNVDETISRELDKRLPSATLPPQKVDAPDARMLPDNSAIFKAVCRIQDERGIRYTASTLANWFSMTTATFNKTLKSLGVQYRSGGRWHIADDLKERGLADTATLTIRTAAGNLNEHLSLVWTETGKWFLFVLFYQHGFIRTPPQKIH